MAEALLRTGRSMRSGGRPAKMSPRVPVDAPSQNLMKQVSLEDHYHLGIASPSECLQPIHKVPFGSTVTNQEGA